MKGVFDCTTHRAAQQQARSRMEMKARQVAHRVARQQKLTQADKHFSSEHPGASSRWQRTTEHPSSLHRERSVSIDVYRPGDIVEYNSVTLGSWANAVVGKVYPNGELQLLGDPGPGATRQQIAAAKGHVLKEYAHPSYRTRAIVCARTSSSDVWCLLVLLLAVALTQRACVGALLIGKCK